MIVVADVVFLSCTDVAVSLQARLCIRPLVDQLCLQAGYDKDFSVLLGGSGD